MFTLWLCSCCCSWDLSAPNQPGISLTAVKTIWIGVWLSLGSIAAYAGISGALSGAARPPSETPVAARAPPPSLSASAGVIALDKSSDMQPGLTDDHNLRAASLSEYVFLHKTRNEHVPPRTMVQVNACPE